MLQAKAAKTPLSPFTKVGIFTYLSMDDCEFFNDIFFAPLLAVASILYMYTRLRYCLYPCGFQSYTCYTCIVQNGYLSPAILNTSMVISASSPK